MTMILILNITLAVLVVGGIVALLGRAIASDRVEAPTSQRAHRSRVHATSGSASATPAPIARIQTSRA
jgi:hypothetical protein